MFVNRAVPGAVNQQAAIVSGAPTPNFFWPMQEGSGTTTTDTIASTVATLDAATWSVSGGRNSTNCVNFANSQSVYSTDLFNYDTLTLCAWIYPTSLNAYKSILSKRNASSNVHGSSSDEFELYISNTQTLWFKMWNSSSVETLFVSSTGTVPQNQWSHVVACSGGAGQTGYIYINGTQDGSAAHATTIRNATSIFQIGGMTINTVARSFNGNIQEVRVYNYALSQSQVTAVYNATTP